MFPEYRIIEKSEEYYGTYKASATTGTINSNQQIITNLCDMMLQIWEEWQRDTRHYQPSQKTYKGYLEKIASGEAKLDADLLEYQTGKQVIKDCREFIKLVVLYRVRDRRKCKVF